jgi:hypothetical protein
MVCEASEYSEELSVVDIIVSFGFIECLGMKAYCNMFSLVILLG